MTKNKTIDLGTAMASPVFVAVFADSQVTRMSVYHDAGARALDVSRGLTLSHVAYQARTKKSAPPIVEARFETRHGEVLQQYDADQLGGVS
jgi:hypothetical protein